MEHKFVKEGRVQQPRSGKPIIKKEEVKLEINEEEANMLKYLGNLTQVLL